MRIRATQGEEEAPVNLMPLIDMVFLLLIFFLVATTFAQEERELDIRLPGTAVVQSLSAQPQELIINIKKDGKVVISGQDYARDALNELLRRVVRDSPNRKVLLRADRYSYHMHFADVASLCREVGVNPLNIGYLFQPNRPVAVQ